MRSAWAVGKKAKCLLVKHRLAKVNSLPNEAFYS